MARLVIWDAIVPIMTSLWLLTFAAILSSDTSDSKKGARKGKYAAPNMIELLNRE